MKLRLVVILGAWIVLLSFGFLFSDLVTAYARQELQVIGGVSYRRMLFVVVTIYVLAAALPFVPGAEIGLALLVAFGSPVVPVVYAAMLLALALAFLLGRLIPARHLCRAFRFVHLEQSAALVERVSDLPKNERAEFLAQNLPKGWVGLGLRHRYVALALILNIPGNTILGGGGGISLIAGLSRMFSIPGFLLTIALAVAPIPLLFHLTGYGG